MGGRHRIGRGSVPGIPLVSLPCIGDRLFMMEQRVGLWDGEAPQLCPVAVGAGDLQRLLDTIGYCDTDVLWFAGDLVNRGAQSLRTLEFVAGLGDRARCVLGNHDLHLLAAACGSRPAHKSDTFYDVLEAPNRDELLDWLRHQPLIDTVG